jgi:hypothetical protein
MEIGLFHFPALLGSEGERDERNGERRFYGGTARLRKTACLAALTTAPN